MAGPFTSEVHVPRPLTEEDKKKLPAYAKRAEAPLYVYRRVKNAAEIIAWAKDQGIETTLPADDMHVTVTYSRLPVDWMKMGSPWSSDKNGDLEVQPGGARMVDRLGADGSATVLLFASSDLSWRHEDMVRNGASWDWAEYQPHITLSYQVPADLDLSTLKPYAGKIVLGPEVFEPITENWADSIVEKDGHFATFFKAAGVNEELGLVFGWGIICKEGGKDYRDPQGNHIPEDAMVEATTDFMKSERVHGDMHERGTTPELSAGMVVHSFPLTTEIAKAMGISTDKTGWMIATAPDPAMLAKFKSGEYTGFSIGGEHIELDGKPVGAA